MKEVLKAYVDIGLLEVVSKLLLFLICFWVALCIVALAQKNRVFGKTAIGLRNAWKGFLRFAGENTERRLKEEERLQREQGNREKKNIFYRMDEVLLQSGLKKRLPFVTVELLLCFFSVLCLLLCYFVTLLTGKLLLGITAVTAAGMCGMVVCQFLLQIRRKRIEDSILQFANLIENYARTTDDIVAVFGKIYPYLEEPLRSAVGECYTQAHANGDFGGACDRLSVTIGNRYFSDLLANIEICSRHEANYEEVMKGNKEIIRTHLEERDIRLAMAANARMEIMVLLVTGALICPIVNDMMSGALFFAMFNSVIGNIFIALILLLLLYCCHVLLTIGQEVER